MPRDDDDVSLGDAPRHAAPNAGAPDARAVGGLGRVDELPSGHQRRHPLHHVVDLGGVHLMQVGAPERRLRAEDAVHAHPVVAGDLDDPNRAVADSVAGQRVDELLDVRRRDVRRLGGVLGPRGGRQQDEQQGRGGFAHGGLLGRRGIRISRDYRDRPRAVQAAAGRARGLFAGRPMRDGARCIRPAKHPAGPLFREAVLLRGHLADIALVMRCPTGASRVSVRRGTRTRAAGRDSGRPGVLSCTQWRRRRAARPDFPSAGGKK